MPDIRDIPDPEQFLPEPTTPLWVWIALALGLISLAILLYFLFRKKTVSEPAQLPIETAREEMEKLKQEIDLKPAHATATELSLIMRRYLSSALNDPALFETNEEFSLRPGALKSLKGDSKEKITQFLRDLSTLKYTPSDRVGKEGRFRELITSQVSEGENLLPLIDADIKNTALLTQQILQQS
ncbi:MAG: DUF4381 family protein [Akkermansiaceae bacterium]